MHVRPSMLPHESHAAGRAATRLGCRLRVCLAVCLLGLTPCLQAAPDDGPYRITGPRPTGPITRQNHFYQGLK